VNPDLRTPGLTDLTKTATPNSRRPRLLVHVGAWLLGGAVLTAALAACTDSTTTDVSRPQTERPSTTNSGTGPSPWFDYVAEGRRQMLALNNHPANDARALLDVWEWCEDLEGQPGGKPSQRETVAESCLILIELDTPLDADERERLSVAYNLLTTEVSSR
jgi:hypothetical protein